ncbi:MAG: vanadium nitrogenase [Lachnospiraceae bacterium]
MAFLASLIQYVVVFIIMTGVACGGVFLGRTLRIQKDKKTALQEAENQKNN